MTKTIAAVLLLAGALASCSSEQKGPPAVQSKEMGLTFSSPPDWIVRQLDNEGEHYVAITRELLEGFPRFRVGFTAITVNVARRGHKVKATVMARDLCQMAAQRGAAFTECSESSFEGFTVVEWKANEGVDQKDTEPSVTWVKCLADDAADTLIRIVFEAPRSEWAAQEKTAKAMMNGVHRLAE
jgi:hypothetical protein